MIKLNKLNITKDDRILIIAPHPDDECIGCGGLVSIYGQQCDIIVVTDGCKGLNGYTIEDRVNESKKFAEMFKVNSIKFMMIEDSTLDNYSFIPINYDSYSKIFIPQLTDMHPDHRALYRIIKNSIVGKELYSYETVTPSTSNNIYYIDISNYLHKLLDAVNIYKSQDTCYYKKIIEGIRLLNAALVGCDYAEVYSLIER